MENDFLSQGAGVAFSEQSFLDRTAFCMQAAEAMFASESEIERRAAEAAFRSAAELMRGGQWARHAITRYQAVLTRGFDDIEILTPSYETLEDADGSEAELAAHQESYFGHPAGFPPWTLYFRAGEHRFRLMGVEISPLAFARFNEQKAARDNSLDFSWLRTQAEYRLAYPLRLELLEFSSQQDSGLTSEAFLAWVLRSDNALSNHWRRQNCRFTIGRHERLGYTVNKLGNPPALPGDSQGLTV